MYYSVILPTFGRPDEVENFLQSILVQEFKDFEVVVVDGSKDDILHPVINDFKDKLNLSYYHEKGLGASESRNLGCDKSKGEFLVFIDSDCIVPSDYFIKVDKFLSENSDVDAFGGPDAADKNFTPFQKAVNYAMTSFPTTGGIRGKKNHVGKFQLRGFNMGVKREAFFKVGGYSGMQVAEDIDLSMRLIKLGYKTALIHDAFVYHRRKASIKIFWKQLFFHGKGRIDLHIKHGNALKFVHLLPSIFSVGFFIGLVLSIFVQPILYLFLLFVLGFALIVFIDSGIQNRSLFVAVLSTIASFELLFAYGFGVIRNIIVRMIFNSGKDSLKSVELKK